MKKNWDWGQPQNNVDLHPRSTSYSPAYAVCVWAGVSAPGLMQGRDTQCHRQLLLQARVQHVRTVRDALGAPTSSQKSPSSEVARYLLDQLLSLAQIIFCLLPKTKSLFQQDFFADPLRRKISSLEGEGLSVASSPSWLPAPPIHKCKIVPLPISKVSTCSHKSVCSLSPVPM